MMKHITVRIEDAAKARIDKFIDNTPAEYYVLTGKKLTQSDVIRMVMNAGFNVLDSGSGSVAQEAEAAALTKELIDAGIENARLRAERLKQGDEDIVISEELDPKLSKFLGELVKKIRLEAAE